MEKTKPPNWKELRQDLKLATLPIKLDELQQAIDKGCHPDVWVLEPDLTPLHCIIRYAGTSSLIDDEDATGAAKILIDAGANVNHKVNVLRGTNTVLQTAEKYLEHKKQNYPKLFELLKHADEQANVNNAKVK